jgi:hypothetical protein
MVVCMVWKLRYEFEPCEGSRNEAVMPNLRDIVETGMYKLVGIRITGFFV